MGLRLENVTKMFGNKRAVDHLNLHIDERQMFGLLGANGAGKTTTFRMILGLLKATEGCVTWDDEPIDYHKSHLIGYLPEERGLYPKLTVKEQILYLGQLRGMKRKAIISELERWLQRFKIEDYMQKKNSRIIEREPAEDSIHCGCHSPA